MPFENTVSITQRDSTTEDATWFALTNIELPESCTACVTFDVVGSTPAGVSACFKVSGAAKRVGAGDAEIVELFRNVINPVKDVGAVTWDCDVSVFAPNNLQVRVRGQAGTTIHWGWGVSGGGVYHWVA